MPDQEGPENEAEAIRQILHEGAHGDYSDIADAVKNRFGFLVGSRLVEEVVTALQREAEQTAKSATGPGEATASAPAADSHQSVLAFVESMGGFDQARAAIDELEAAMRRLMK